MNWNLDTIHFVLHKKMVFEWDEHNCRYVLKPDLENLKDLAFVTEIKIIFYLISWKGCVVTDDALQATSYLGMELMQEDLWKAIDVLAKIQSRSPFPLVV